MRREDKELLSYITEVRSAMRMDNWDVLVTWDDGMEEDVLASTVQSTNHDSLHMFVNSREFPRLSPELKQNTIVHEFIHALHRDVSLLWEACTKHNPDIATSQAHSWDTDFHTFLERFVSNATRLISPTCPLWPGKGEHIGQGVVMHDG